MPKVDNAIILAAGKASRFAPLSYEKPKALIQVKGEVLIERQIRQLQKAGIKEIIIVVGYKKEQFRYLEEKYHVKLVENPEFETRNNNGSIYAARDYINNTYICSSDNYFPESPFCTEENESCYAALYSEGATSEWCMHEDGQGYVDRVTIGGENAWYMMGHAFWSEAFTRKFLSILKKEYEYSETLALLWEGILARHLGELPIRIKKYEKGQIQEFDSLEELRAFDSRYIEYSGSTILEALAKELHCPQSKFKKFSPIEQTDGVMTGFEFEACGKTYCYIYGKGCIERGLKQDG